MRRGLTLVELLVVLTILVALTTVAIRATEGTLQQSRYDATVRTLQAIEDAVLGPASQREPDGTVRLSGFVSDMGRRPRVTQETLSDPLLPGELWELPPGGATYQLRQATLDPEVWLGSGWGGPYLRLAPGADSVTDGWSRPFELFNTSGTPAAVGEDLGAVTSPGDPQGGAFAATLGITFADASSAPPVDRLSATLQVTVSNVLPTGDPVVVLLVEPDQTVASNRLGEDPQLYSPPGLTVSGLLVGTKVLRAYQGPSVTVADLALSDPLTRKSRIRRLALTRDDAVELVLE